MKIAIPIDMVYQPSKNTSLLRTLKTEDHFSVPVPHYSPTTATTSPLFSHVAIFSRLFFLTVH